jgi:anti-anti-sigma regulatory factor
MTKKELKQIVLDMDNVTFFDIFCLDYLTDQVLRKNIVNQEEWRELTDKELVILAIENDLISYKEDIKPFYNI